MAEPKKQNQMADEAAAERAKMLADRGYIADQKAWDAEGEEFGGKSDILILEVGEVAGPLTYIGHQEMTTDLGDTTVHLGANGDGETMRLPIQATFVRAVSQAALRRGDTFLVRRDSDQIKKKGKGSGKPMAIYAIKVTKRAPVPAAATAV